MRSRLQQIRRIVEKEVPAWLGSYEDLDLRLLFISRMIPEKVKGKLVPQLEAEIRKALDSGKSLTLLFIEHRNAPQEPLSVITIDRKFDRVVRALTSWALLQDTESELMPKVPTYETFPPFDVDAAHEYKHPRVLEYAHALGMILFEIPYLSLYSIRQKAVAKQFGHSRRFESLVHCLSPYLDSELHTLLPKALRALWEHDLWLSRPVNFAAAEIALSSASVSVLKNLSAIWNSPNDPGPEIESRIWTNDQGEEFAWAHVFCVSVLDPNKTEVHLEVFGSYFFQEDARRLIDCHRETHREFDHPVAVSAPGCGHA